MLICFQFDLDIDSSQLGYKVTEDVRYGDDVNLPTILAESALPLWLDVGEGRASGWSLFQDW